MSEVGCRGVLLIATRKEAKEGLFGPGEVLLNVRGGTEKFIAWSKNPLPKDTEVMVIFSKGSRNVLVEPLDSIFTTNLPSLSDFTF